MVLLILALYKEKQNKVCEELFQMLGESNENKMNFDDLSKLKYMEMVIKEAMRLFPAIPLIARQLTEDVTMGNYTIPKGTNIGIPIFALHRNEAYWEEPLKFDPERFTFENIKKQNPYAFIPFSAGPRNCLGVRYAWIFMKLALSRLLSKYEFHTNIKDLSEIKFEFEISLKIINGYPIRITPRQR
ncbi:cytochrome P450 4V2-like [Chrysoperla carnea]|uniref:cytochrome P450 4V2-like n=1 Tax=Chrysoperla carnea TaxID=189513 RepID=UPI001D08D616|nr:cytochrome P450 4V2-like [Chrysoperla carnea]